MEPSIIISLVFSALTAVSVFITIKMNLRKMAQEKAAETTKIAIMQKQIEDYKISLDHAHDKIRDLYSKANDTSNVITEIKVTLTENTRVLREVEKALMLIARIEERIDAHMRDDGK